MGGAKKKKKNPNVVIGMIQPKNRNFEISNRTRFALRPLTSPYLVMLTPIEGFDVSNVEILSNGCFLHRYRIDIRYPTLTLTSSVSLQQYSSSQRTCHEVSAHSQRALIVVLTKSIFDASTYVRTYLVAGSGFITWGIWYLALLL